MSEEKRYFWKPRIVLEEIYELCRRKRSLNGIRPILVEKLNAKGDDLKKFTHHFDGHRWQGYIYQKRNSLMGSLFGFWDNKFFIIRGYPKIKYVEDSRVLDRDCIVENKWDGTNLGIWLMPDNSIHGKTRLVETWMGQGWKGRNWKDLFDKAVKEEQVRPILKEDYQIFGELCGSLNEGEFVKYSFPIKFIVFDIVDRRNYGFLPYEKKIDLITANGLEYAGLYWKGVLTSKEAERIEFEAKQFVKDDGYEGFVGKYFSAEDKDVYMCKLKCNEIKEKCWEVSATTLSIPSSIISKAIQKAMENMSKFSTKDDFEKFVEEELKEEASEELISKSRDKIKRMIYEKLTPFEGQDEVIKYLQELEGKIDIKNKGKVMSMLADKFIGWKPSVLYNIYQSYLIKKS